MTAVRVPGPLESYRGVRRDIVGFLTELARDCGDFVPFRVLAFPYALVNDPVLIREALVEQSEALIIKGGASKGLSRLIGHGILTNRGADWRRSRATLQPLFNQGALKGHLATMASLIDETSDRWRALPSGETVPVQHELLALSIRITCATLFGYRPDPSEAHAAADAITVFQREGMERFVDGADYLPWLPLPRNLRIGGARRALTGLAQRCIAEGCTVPVDEILSVLFAGTESPVNTLCFALKLLEESPDWLGRLRDQLRDPAAPSGWENVDRLDPLAQVISEALRLYPAGWAFERFASVDCTLGGHPVPKGTRLLFSPYVLHRNPKFWRDPLRFDPTRFATSPHAPDGVPKYGYLPFGAGPRSCIGSRLAWAEMRLMLAAIVARCEWKTEGGAALTAEGAFKIRLSRPLRLLMQMH